MAVRVRFAGMDYSVAVGILILALLIVGVVVLNVWWRRHRSKETPAQKREEDEQIEVDAEVW